MSTLIGLDLGTTTLTALALDAATGRLARAVTRANSCALNTSSNRSEWDAAGIARLALECLRELGAADAVAVGVTGQQHGVVIGDRLINWQDKRAEEPMPGVSRSWAAEARERAGDAASIRAGCRLSAGYMAVTLFWLANNGGIPPGARPCFLMDRMTSVLTGTEPVTDPTCAASSGALDVTRRDWDDATLSALGLSGKMLPRVVPSGTQVGGLTAQMAALTGLPRGTPVYVGVGDNQASFLGSVADRASSVLVNVGTGGQVAMWSPDVCQDRQVEARPFFDGYLSVLAGLSGGAAYAVLERFFRAVGREVLSVEGGDAVYDVMNRLAAQVPAGADGLTCEPFFTGTRHEPWLRASWTGLTAANLTPGHLARALLEGMAKAFALSVGRVAQLCQRIPQRLVGAGNGVRSNTLLAEAIGVAVGMPLTMSAHREEAAFGAALLAGVGCGAVADLDAAGRLLASSIATARA